MREKIKLNDTFQDVIVKMSEGNPGAVRVLMELLQKPQAKSLKTCLFLDEMNIRGQQIWVGYKDCCGEDLDKFINAVEDNDESMIKTINQECLYDGYDHKATLR